MDTITQAFYDQRFQVLFFVEKKAGAFQDFFAAIMERRYPADFQRVRPWGSAGDWKNDGYLRSKRMLFQCYAPNEMEADKCLSKIEEDFLGALPYWRDHFDVWVFVHNSREGLGPQVTKRLLELDAAHAPLRTTSWGFTELHMETFQLSEHDLGAVLGPAPSRESMVNLGMADLQPLLAQLQELPAVSEPDLRPVPSSKLAYNMLSDAVGHLLRAGMTRAPLVRKFFELQGVHTRRDRIAEAFKAKYQDLRAAGLGPNLIFHELHKFASGDLLPDPQRQSATLAVLAFLFEDCEIFERPPDDETGSEAPSGATL